MNKKIIYIGLIIILAGALIGSYIAEDEPVARVGTVDITTEEYDAKYSVLEHYTATINEMQGGDAVRSPSVVAELRRLTLDALIEQHLISSELTARLGERAQVRVRDRLAAASSTAELSDAVMKLYGLSVAEFEREVLFGVAQQELLVELLGGSVAFERWLLDARKSATVSVYIDGLLWQNGELVDTTQG